MVLIIEGKMPTKCYDCLTIGLDFENCPLNNSESADANTWMRCDHRHPDCPIVGEISDKHGRIVDVVDVMNQIRICFTECKLKNVEVTPFILATYIAKAPTIVEATNGSDN